MLSAHPLSSYCQKALAALCERAMPFEFRMLGHRVGEAWRSLIVLAGASDGAPLLSIYKLSVSSFLPLTLVR